MLPSLAYNKDGKIQSPVSVYQPPIEIKELFSVSMVDLQVGDEILNRPFREFNDMSLLNRASLDQKDWLGWSPGPSADPDESWMFTGTSSITRNKIISTAAHLTQQVIYPAVFAQNEDDEADEASAYVMNATIEFNCRKSNYEQTFLYGVISGLVNPVSYFRVDYVKQYLDILQGTQSNYTRRKVIDEMFSGFQNSLIPLDEVMLGNPYCFDIQRQPFIINRRRITYGEAKALHGNKEAFIYVRPGIVTQLGNDGIFYDIPDIGDGLVEEVTFSYRGQDREFVQVNGIYLSNPNVDYLPMSHRRIQTAEDGTAVDLPMYNLVKYGSEPIDAMRFAYFKSLASKISNDKELVDRMRQNAVDASTFAAFPSIFTIGAGKLDKSVFIPATVVDLKKDAKVSPATGLANPSFAYSAAREAEQSISESTVDSEQSGVGGSGNKTAREAMLLQQNAITTLGVMGRMITQGMIKPIGELMVDDIIRYQTVGETMELANGELGTKYFSFVLNKKAIEGQRKDIVIKFTDAWAGRKFTDKQIREKRVKMFEDKGENQEIYEVNPALFIKRKFSVVIEPDALKPKDDPFDKTFKTEVYDRAIANPLIMGDPQKMADVTRDFLFEPAVKGDSAKYIPKDTKRAIQNILPGGGNNPAGNVKEGVVGQTVQNRAMQGTNLGVK